MQETNLSYYEKSEEGLWVKAVLGLNNIDISWQIRHEVVNGKVNIIGAQGEIIESVSQAQADFDELWVSCGSIPIGSDDMIDMCGVSNFDLMLNGLMRHVVRLIVLGWGETPDDVVGWFGDIKSCDFIVSGKYVVGDEPIGMFDGLSGSIVEMDGEFEDCPTGKIVVTDDSSFGFNLGLPSFVGEFLMSTVPI